jgi:hypothetical protein
MVATQQCVSSGLPQLLSRYALPETSCDRVNKSVFWIIPLPSWTLCVEAACCLDRPQTTITSQGRQASCGPSAGQLPARCGRRMDSDMELQVSSAIQGGNGCHRQPDQLAHALMLRKRICPLRKY